MRGDLDSKTIPDTTTTGLSWLVTVDYDQELTEPEGDGYTPKQVAAFQAGDWNYVVVGVTPVIDGIELDSMADYLGAVEYGYFTLTDEDDNPQGTRDIDLGYLIAGMPDDDEGYPVPDMIREAKSTLKARLAELAPKFADIARSL